MCGQPPSAVQDGWMSWIEFFIRVFGFVILCVCYLAAKEIWEWRTERRRK
jgi:hypothetical protein